MESGGPVRWMNQGGRMEAKPTKRSSVGSPQGVVRMRLCSRPVGISPWSVPVQISDRSGERTVRDPAALSSPPDRLRSPGFASSRMVADDTTLR